MLYRPESYTGLNQAGIDHSKRGVVFVPVNMLKPAPTRSRPLMKGRVSKDGLQGKKKSNNAQEFLIEKKNPLILPPDFDKLPLPKTKSEKDDSENEFDLKDVLENSSEQNVVSSETNNKSSTEKSILEKIKNN